ncbi:MAG: tyrosine-type recombinase/integrase [Zetaproteobacteria bacterium]|nr:tyrosine-type recombinase/integrase [Zetaproteobacteria bacterium]
MRAEYRTRRNGDGYYSLLYTDTVSNKRTRVPQEKIKALHGGELKTLQEAKRMMKHLAPKYVPLKKRIQEAERASRQSSKRMELLEFYARKQQKHAPNSYQTNVHYLKCYVFVYFYERARVTDLNRWPHYFEKFLEWLEGEASSLQRPGVKLSYATMNRCIASLNTFLKHLYHSRKTNVLHNCPSFPRHLCRTRGVEAVIPEEAQVQVTAALRAAGHTLEATFFQLLCVSGMRFNEALGISLEDVYVGQLQHSILSEKLNQYGITHYGYLVLKSQPSHPGRGLRDRGGVIQRKPLKGARVIDDKHARLIPITDAELWQQLCGLYNQQVELQQRRVYGAAGDQYALFEGIDKSSSYRRLAKACASLGLPTWSWHCCRHSCATRILGSTGDLMLARMWLGHRSQEVIERYVHVHEALVRDAQRRGGLGGQDFQVIQTSAGT